MRTFASRSFKQALDGMMHLILIVSNLNMLLTGNKEHKNNSVGLVLEMWR